MISRKLSQLHGGDCSHRRCSYTDRTYHVARHCFKCFVSVHSCNSHSNPTEEFNVNIFIPKMGKLRHRAGKEVANSWQ